MAPRERDADLPERFPIFPLPNVVLFPDARLPLHIFEPRYRHMTQDALAGDRIIGMVLLRDEEPAENPPVYPVGCAGRIGACEELSDGRFNFILEGLRRFRLLDEEVSPRGYRCARVELLPDPPFAELAPAARAELEGARVRLEEGLLELAGRMAPESVPKLQQRMAQLDPVQLVHALAFGLDASPIEKQGLLESPDPLARCEALARLIEFRRAESELSYAPKNIN